MQQYLAVDGSPVELVERSPEPSPVLDRLARLAPWLRRTHVVAEDERLRVSGAFPHGEITFLGPVAGRQLEPFVELLRALATREVDYDTPATPGRLAELTRCVALGVGVSSQCPYCPSVAAAALRIACASPRVDVVIARADLGLFGDVRAVPTIRVDGVVRRTGPTSEWQLVELVTA